MNALQRKDDGTNFTFEDALPVWIEVPLHPLNVDVRQVVSIMQPFSVQSDFQKKN
jgi:hypothetical protein